MRLDLVLLTAALSVLACALAYMTILLKRAALAVFCTFLDHAASEIR